MLYKQDWVKIRAILSYLKTDLRQSASFPVTWWKYNTLFTCCQDSVLLCIALDTNPAANTSFASCILYHYGSWIGWELAVYTSSAKIYANTDWIASSQYKCTFRSSNQVLELMKCHLSRPYSFSRREAINSVNSHTCRYFNYRWPIGQHLNVSGFLKEQLELYLHTQLLHTYKQLVLTRPLLAHINYE